MEKSKIEQFANDKQCYVAGMGYSSGFGYSSNDGSGAGFASGSGFDTGIGCASGIGNLIENGDDVGLANGDGHQNGSGYGFGIASFCGQKVYNIDTIATIIQSVHGNYAKGFILNSDFTLKKTYIAKGFGWFAHGSTLREAHEYLEYKIETYMSIEEKQDEFKRKFNKNDSYSGEEFFEWHHLLTGSCLLGRETFVKAKGLDLKAKYTVNEFLKIVEGAYGWDSIEGLKEFYD